MSHAPGAVAAGSAPTEAAATLEQVRNECREAWIRTRPSARCAKPSPAIADAIESAADAMGLTRGGDVAHRHRDSTRASVHAALLASSRPPLWAGLSECAKDLRISESMLRRHHWRVASIVGSGLVVTPAPPPPPPPPPPLPGLPSAAALEAEYGLFCRGAPHPMEIGDGGAASCACARCGRWARFVRGEEPEGGGWPRYEVLCTELVDGLAGWLRGVAASRPSTPSSPSPPSPLRVLEVGAGDGRLTHHLRAALAGAPVELVATDSFARGLAAAAPVAAVAYDAAVADAAFAPDVVLCCWMPLGEDWTRSFRARRSVRHYVLIGEVDDGCCGRPWQTWGYKPFGGGGGGGGDGDDADGDGASCSVSSTSSGSSSSQDEGDEDDGDDSGDGEAWRRVYERSPQLTPWGAEGWRRHELRDISARQLCRTDSPWSATRHSRTTVFSRDGAG